MGILFGILIGYAMLGAVCGAVAASLASERDNSTVGFVLGFLFGPLGLLAALLIYNRNATGRLASHVDIPDDDDHDDQLRCPDCGRPISEHAAACPHCGCPSQILEVARLRFRQQRAAAARANVRRAKLAMFERREEERLEALRQRQIEFERQQRRAAAANTLKDFGRVLTAPFRVPTEAMLKMSKAIAKDDSFMLWSIYVLLVVLTWGSLCGLVVFFIVKSIL